VEPSQDDWDRKVVELAAGDRWIMDGNYSRTLHLRLPRADAVILLDPPTIVCLLGIITRGWLQRRRMRPDLAHGCAEHPPDLQFLRYVAMYKWRSLPRVLQMVRAAPHARMIHLRSRREARAFLAGLQNGIGAHASGNPEHGVHL
jgi:adenylate kinase family enzyme